MRRLLEWLMPLDRRRRRLLARAPPGPLADFLAVPFPAPDAECRDITLLAMDVETTGLDPARDELLSVGFVPVRGLRIHLAECYHTLVRPACDIPPATAVVHGIFDDRSRTGRPLADVVPEVLAALAGRVMIAHYARIEVGFLAVACRRLYGFAPVLPVIDTLRLEHEREIPGHHATQPGALRLAAARERYGLPRYPAHDALTDAIAAGELFLAQLAHHGGSDPPRLRDFTR